MFISAAGVRGSLTTQNTSTSYTAQRVVFAVAFSICLLIAAPLHAQLSLGGYAESAVENSVDESVEDTVEEAVVEQIEDRVLSLGGPPDDIIENTVEDAVEENITQSLEDVVEEDVTESVEGSIEEVVQENIAQNIEEDIVENVEDIVEETVSENLEADIEQSVEQEVEQTVTSEIELSVASSVEVSVQNNVESSVEREIDQLIQDIESEIEIDEDRIHKNEWLVMANPEVFEELAKEGYLFDKVTDLPGIGMRLAEVAAPSSFDITEARQGVIDVVGTGRAKVDLNHIYTAGVISPNEGGGVLPRDAMPLPVDSKDLKLRIGMIDSSVDTSHPSLGASSIHNKSFVSGRGELPNSHGTAIASILVANNSDYTGLAPGADVYAAAVFQKDKVRGEFASTVSLVLALDWLVSSGVDVVNISLAGPPNRLLEAAIEQAAKRNVLVVAAAGNGGPMAKPMYPAAYGTVIAVTAVDKREHVFRLANRGSYLELAAPGVGLQHAQAGGGYASSSGTSFAVPFVVAAAARIRLLHPQGNARELLYESAKDLGAVGRDDIYGYGLLNFGKI